jgi:hypothetical protein
MINVFFQADFWPDWAFHEAPLKEIPCFIMTENRPCVKRPST